MKLIRYIIDVITDNITVKRGTMPFYCSQRIGFIFSGFIFSGFIFSGFIFDGLILVELVIWREHTIF
jgi:hypothetical protein